MLFKPKEQSGIHQNSVCIQTKYFEIYYCLTAFTLPAILLFCHCRSGNIQRAASLNSLTTCMSDIYIL